MKTWMRITWEVSTAIVIGVLVYMETGVATGFAIGTLFLCVAAQNWVNAATGDWLKSVSDFLTKGRAQ